MSTVNPDDARALAARLLRDASEQMQKQADRDRVRELVRISDENARPALPSIQLSQATLKNLVQAIEQDLAQAPGKAAQATEKAKLEEERVTKLETQTRTLADVVLKISETVEGVLPAVRLLTEELDDSKK